MCLFSWRHDFDRWACFGLFPLHGGSGLIRCGIERQELDLVGSGAQRSNFGGSVATRLSSQSNMSSLGWIHFQHTSDSPCHWKFTEIGTYTLVGNACPSNGIPEFGIDTFIDSVRATLNLRNMEDRGWTFRVLVKSYDKSICWPRCINRKLLTDFENATGLNHYRSPSIIFRISSFILTFSTSSSISQLLHRQSSEPHPPLNHPGPQGRWITLRIRNN